MTQSRSDALAGSLPGAAHGGRRASEAKRRDAVAYGWPERGVFVLFAIFIVLTPLWLGSNSPLLWGINASVAGLLLIAFEMSLLLSGRPHAVNLKRLGFETIAFVLVAGWICVQLSPWTPAGWHHAIWDLTSQTLGEPIAGSITISPDLTFLALLRLMTAAAVFWLALQFGRDPAMANRFLQWIAVAGFCYALYGVVSFVLFPDMLLIFEKGAYRESVTSTFVNRNTYATYAGLSLIVTLALVLRDLGLAKEGGNLRVAAARFIQSAGGKTGLYMVAAFIIAAALVLTASRAGVTSAMLGVAMLLAFTGIRAQRRRSVVFPIFVIALVALAAALYGFGGTYLERLGELDIETNDRLAAYALTWQSIRDAPLLGFGYGTFSEVLPMYRDSTLGPWGAWDKAHNTYLEVVQGLGLPAAGLFVALVFSLVGRCSGATIRRNRHITAPLVATAASFVVGVHALADFSLQIQAVALTWVALLGLGVAQSWSSNVSSSA